jgi:hypothetical protein
MSTCPVCLNEREDTQINLGSLDGDAINCSVCGRFNLSRSAKMSYFRTPESLSKLQRATLSYIIRNSQAVEPDDDAFLITSFSIKQLTERSYSLPAPSVRANNLINFIGQIYLKTGEPVDSLPVATSAVVGCVDNAAAHRLLEQLEKLGFVQFSRIKAYGLAFGVSQIELTLAGWDRFELQKSGKTSANYGFLALKFTDEVLNDFVNNHVKPATKEVGYDLIDMRDVAEAGIIDNLMRSRIRDAAFLIADLTHDSPGAYWEAGYAEGMGKPVLYICERSKWEEFRTHFDTNHSTTVLWSPNSPEEFRENYLATLRRSLGLLG